MHLFHQFSGKMMLAAALTAAAITTTARADSVGTVDLEYTGHIGNRAHLKFNNGTDSGDYDGYRGRGVAIGLYTFDVTNPTGSGDLVPAYGFCIDLAQDAPDRYPATYDISYLSDAPNPAMGADKAGLISQLWARYFDADWFTDSDTSDIREEASAFSLAIWEIVNEDYKTDVNDYDVTDYNSDPHSYWDWHDYEYKTYYKHGFDASDAWPEEQLANVWLHSLTDNGPTANLVALTNDCYQDFVMQLPPPVIPVASVPLPAAFPAGLAVLGVLGLGGYIRRRRRHLAAA